MSFSSYSSSTSYDGTKGHEMKWNPETVIPIINPDTHRGTCVGNAPSMGRRCRNPRSPYSSSLLLQALAKLDPLSAAKSPKLRHIAEDMLCWRHGGQADTVVRQWQTALRNEAKTASHDKDIAEMITNAEALLEKLRGYKKEQATDWDRPTKSSMPKPRASWEDYIKPEEDDAKYEEASKQKRQRKEAEARQKRQQREQEDKKRKEEETRRQEAKRKENQERRDRDRREAEQKASKEKQQREKEREARANAAKQRANDNQEWATAWQRYDTAWTKCEAKQTNPPTAMPWPTLSGKWQDVTIVNVRSFFRTAPGYEDPEVRFQIMSRENKRWHTDKVLSRFGQEAINGPRKEQLDTMSKLIVVLWKESRSSRVNKSRV